MSRRPLTNGQRWWYSQIEQRAYTQLHALQRPHGDGRPALWDGTPPVPVEHVAEHLLGLSIVYEVITEREDEEILGCLRPEAREIVLNETHAQRFRDVPGTERHTIGHEIGHADVFGDVAATMQAPLPGLAATGCTRKRSSSRGDVRVLSLRPSDALKRRLAGCNPEVRREAYRRFELEMRAQEQEQIAAGADSPMVRRAVDHYAATLLMPADLLRREAEGLDLSRRSSVDHLARRFVVSRQSLLIQLENLNLIHGVADDGTIKLESPVEAQQPSLF
ncbi:MAG TPA: hypothetical protein VN650_08615 [Gemmatimonadaceae bacterium]|nr:hypothetical protein [Gemmatimonadaceae bacterium]